MSNASDWVHFYQRNVTKQVVSSPQSSPPAIDQVPDATVVFAGNTTSSHLNPEGRISKPPRRRTRASRKTPATILNTDTTNFRAMVQRFTGIPSTPYSPEILTGAVNLNFRVGNQQTYLNPNITTPSSSIYNTHLHHLQHQEQQQEYMLRMNNKSDGFLQGFGNTRPNLEVSNGFFLQDSISNNSSHHVLPRPFSSNENRNTNRYIL